MEEKEILIIQLLFPVNLVLKQICLKDPNSKSFVKRNAFTKMKHIFINRKTNLSN